MVNNHAIMITASEKEIINQQAKEFAVNQIYLFGSSVGESDESHDIDLAVSGLKMSDFFKFYADLICALSRPVDLVDLDRDSRFTQIIRKEGVLLYDHAA